MDAAGAAVAQIAESELVAELAGTGDAGERLALRAPRPWEFQLLRLLAEQTAIPSDQLARFLGTDERVAASVVRHLAAVGYADCGYFLHSEPQWAWLSARGARLSGTGFRAAPPKVGAMARLRAVNEVRIYIARRAPEARWISARSIAREQGKRGYRPNAILEIGQERHAIVVKYAVPREPEREIRILETHMARYDAVVCFANPQPLALLKRLQAKHHWAKLMIHPIPGPQ